MVRLDDLVACYKCRKRFELTGQSTVLIVMRLAIPASTRKISAIAEILLAFKSPDTYRKKLRWIGETSTQFLPCLPSIKCIVTRAVRPFFSTIVAS